MKKFVALLLALTMVFALAACALACGLVAARDPEGVVAILTAD